MNPLLHSELALETSVHVHAHTIKNRIAQGRKLIIAASYL